MKRPPIELGYGLITCQRHPDVDAGWPPLYREALELAQLAEQVGLASVWVSEHHFVDDGHLPSLLPLLAAMAACTTRVTVGTALLLAPLHDPLRLAEDAAVVDLISQGRLVLGLGLGWREPEFDVLGVTRVQRVHRLVRFIETAKQGWRGEPVAGAGNETAFITPLPSQAGGPLLWIGALAEPAIRRAARIADGFMATEVTPEELATQVGWVREERAASDRTGPFTVSLHLPTLCHPAGVAWDEVAEDLRYPGWKYEDMSENHVGAGPLARPMPASVEEMQRLRETSVVGTPAQVAARISAYADAAGEPLHFIARSYLPGIGASRRHEAVLALGEVASLLRHGGPVH